MFISDCEVLVCNWMVQRAAGMISHEACHHMFVVRLFEDGVQRVGVEFSVNPLCVLTTSITGRMKPCLASFSDSSPAFSRILYKKRGESLDDLITCAMTYYAWFYAWFW